MGQRPPGPQRRVREVPPSSIPPRPANFPGPPQYPPPRNAVRGPPPAPRGRPSRPEERASPNTATGSGNLWSKAIMSKCLNV